MTIDAAKRFYLAKKGGLTSEDKTIKITNFGSPYGGINLGVDDKFLSDWETKIWKTLNQAFEEYVQSIKDDWEKWKQGNHKDSEEYKKLLEKKYAEFEQRVNNILDNYEKDNDEWKEDFKQEWKDWRKGIVASLKKDLNRPLGRNQNIRIVENDLEITCLSRQDKRESPTSKV